MSACCGPEKEACEIATTCPRCGVEGHEIGRETVGAMATLEVPARSLGREHYRYCSTPGCPVAYYGGDGVVLHQSDVRVPMNVKDTRLDVPLCYCFGHTRRSIAEEIAAHGRSTASAAIAREIKAGHCACEVKNPYGRCCLGDVRSYEGQVGQERIGARASVRGNSIAAKPA